jgi:predicted secreted protein
MLILCRGILVLGICAGVLAPLESCAGGGPPPVMAIRRIANLGQKPAAANSSLDQGEVLDLENSLDKTLVVGEEFKVALESNAGTGYQWQCQLTNDPIILVDEPPELTPIDTGVVGGRVRTIFVVHGKSVGTVKVSFVLVRPWEKNTAPAKALTLTLTVNDGSSAPH